MSPSRTRPTLAISSTSVLVALAATACNKPAPPPFKPPPAQVGIVTVQPSLIAEPFEFVGQVEPFRRVEVRSRVEGIVTDRAFTEGGVVTKGRSNRSA